MRSALKPRVLRAPLELDDLADDVLARTRHRGRGKRSGVEVEIEILQLMTLQGEKIVRMRMYYEKGEALEAAGLAE